MKAIINEKRERERERERERFAFTNVDIYILIFCLRRFFMWSTLDCLMVSSTLSIYMGTL